MGKKEWSKPEVRESRSVTFHDAQEYGPNDSPRIYFIEDEKQEHIGEILVHIYGD